MVFLFGGSRANALPHPRLSRELLPYSPASCARVCFMLRQQVSFDEALECCVRQEVVSVLHAYKATV